MDASHSSQSRLAVYARVVRTWMLHIVRRTDIGKWRRYDFPGEWDLRSRKIASLIPPGSTVHEFGAGASKLADHLSVGCTLISSDLVERYPGMPVFDLNRRPLPAIVGKQPLVAVLGGVLEYLSDPPAVTQWIARNFEYCIASYECANHTSGLIESVREWIRRNHEGWVNHYTQAGLLQLFSNAGFQLVETALWGDTDPGTIFVFRKHMAKDDPASA